jgi:hypothetical protein
MPVEAKNHAYINKNLLHQDEQPVADAGDFRDLS